MRKVKFFLFAIMLIVLLGILVFIIKVTIARTTIYPYNTSKNYIYDFNQSNANISNLYYKNGKIILDKSDNVDISAFLKVNVETTLLGKYFQPSIELKSGKLAITQYFEHAAKGTRYINISTLMTESEKEITLNEKYISLSSDKVQLISFKNKNIKKEKILVLAPHPDDAEIAAFGLYSDNNESYVITITAGDAGKFKYNEIYQYENKIQHYLKKGELRTWDSITVPLLGGISYEHMVNLGFFDLSLQKMFGEKSKEVKSFYVGTSDINTFRKQNMSIISKGLSGTSSWNSLVENLKYLLEKIKPDIIVTPYPALDTHPDHKYTTVALVEALKSLDIREGALYLYSNHFVLNEYYPYGKLGGNISLPPNFRNKIYFDSVYSHSMSLEKQKDKLFALEAMHDLRLDTEWRFSKSLMKLTWNQIRNDVKNWNNSYYKRSVRSNELFFVLKISNLYKEDILKNILGSIKKY
jgi:LmbE family N-acetylglucosaminyl deacetylase